MSGPWQGVQTEMEVPDLPPRRNYYFTLSVNCVPEKEAQVILESVRKILGDLDGVSVSYSSPITGEDD